MQVRLMLQVKMPKKFRGENSKAVEARARKAAQKEAETERKQQQLEDEYWKEDDKNVLKRLQRKVCTVVVVVVLCLNVELLYVNTTMPNSNISVHVLSRFSIYVQLHTTFCRSLPADLRQAQPCPYCFYSVVKT